MIWPSLNKAAVREGMENSAPPVSPVRAKLVERMSSLKRLIAPVALLLTAFAQGRLVHAAEAKRPSALPSSPAQGEAKRSFLKTYKAASARLSAGLSPLHGKARYREFHGREPGDWVTIEFFIDDGKVRVQRDFGASKENPAAVKAKAPDALLLTPETAAKIIDPSTEFAWTRYQSQKPDKAFSHELGRMLWRFLCASYCFDNNESLFNECIADNRNTLQSVERDPTNNGWLHLSCKFVAPAEDPAWTSRGTIDAWLDDAQDFVIRKTKIVTGEPYMFEAVREASSFVPLDNGGWVPKTISHTVYDLRTAPAESLGPSTKPRAWEERIEFELLGGVETAKIPDSYFSLQSLGATPPHGHRKLWLLLAIAAGALVIVTRAIRKRRRTHDSSFRREDSSPERDIAQ